MMENTRTANNAAADPDLDDRLNDSEDTLDRTIELPRGVLAGAAAGAASAPPTLGFTPGSGRNASAPSEFSENTLPPPLPRASAAVPGQPIFGDGTSSLESRIPPGLPSKRPSPALDPLQRARVSRAAKWGVLLAVLLFIAYLPAHFAAIQARELYFLTLVTAATVFSAVIATGLPRLIIPRAFGRWHEAAEAMRDWLTVGVLTGVLYWAAIQVATLMHVPAAETMADWVQYRLPLLLGAGVIGLLAARAVAIRQEGVLGAGIGSALWQIILQVALLGALERPIERGLNTAFTSVEGMPFWIGAASLVCLLAAGGIIVWAASADASLQQLRRRKRGASGIDDGHGPVNLTLTVIGGRESGKTVLLAGAFYEWSTQNLGGLRIRPAAETVAGDDPANGAGIANLEDVARELYVNNQFPVGTVSTQNLPFNLSYGEDSIARFSFLDYPGGAIAGRVADNRVVQEFWERVEDTDGILLIADMSYVRRAHRDKDWIEVRNAYRTVMQRLVDRNGKRRVVPVALVLTKCDEFINPDTGHIDMDALNAGLKEFQYDELEAEWRQMNAEAGPGFAEFTTWITSAITYSQPQLDGMGRPDYSKPFMIAPPPPAITPTGCAAPLLWMCAKVMRWNVTAFYDINSFLFGSSPRVRRRVDSILEMEKISEQRAGRA